MKISYVLHNKIEKNSLLELREDPSGLNIIYFFSFKHIAGPFGGVEIFAFHE